MAQDDLERVAIADAAALWDWLGANAAQDASVWLVTYKAEDADRYVSREAVLDALIAHGWIDGRRMKLDDRRTMQLIAPRRQQAWWESYKARAARLEAEGRMTEAGRRAIGAAKAAGLWDFFADVDALIDPEDLTAALARRVGAAAWWAAAAPSYRRNVLRWIKSAKTRAKRVAQTADLAARREKIPQM